MNKDLWATLKDIFGEAIEMSPAERDRLLSELDRHNPEIAERLRSLLKEHDSIVLDTLSVQVSLAEPAFDLRQIGPYALEREIGRGGWGTVYLAYRSDDEFRRPLAVKVLRCNLPGFTEALVLERAALSQLQHPNIAMLIDWGNDHELPWLATEFVPGEPVDEYCRTRSLPLLQRLGLFQQLCHAVRYLHGRLIIHRDLKPANVLVTQDGQLKLLDFGISKLPTTRGFAGIDLYSWPSYTPGFAAPEQILRTPVTTATDIYGLGLILYRVLTGAHPYPTENDDSTLLRSAILIGTPRAPESLKDLPAGFRGELRRDLGLILAKCLEKDPEARYASVDALLSDLASYLEKRPISSRRADPLYRLGKFARRNSIALAIASIAVFLVLAGACTAMWKAHAATLARDRERQTVKQLTGMADQLIHSLGDSVRTLRGGMAIRQRMAELALTQLDNIRQAGVQDQELDRELGSAYLTLGKVQGEFLVPHTGNSRTALQSFRNALALLEPIWNGDHNDNQAGFLLVETYGQIAHLSSDLRQATEWLKRAVSVGSAIRGRKSMTRKQEMIVAGPTFWLGENQEHIGDLRGAMASYHAYVSAMNDVLAHSETGGAGARNSRPLLEIGTGWERIALAQEQTGDFDAALRAAKEAKSWLQRAVVLWPGDLELEAEVASNQEWIGDIYRHQRRFAESYRALAACLQGLNYINSVERENKEADFNLAWIHLSFGELRRDERKWNVAESELLQARHLAEADRKLDPNRWTIYLIARIENALGHVLCAKRDFKRAREYYRAAYADAQRSLAESPEDVAIRAELAKSLTGVAKCGLLSGRSIIPGKENSSGLIAAAEEEWRKLRADCPLCIEPLSGLREAEALRFAMAGAERSF